ncbi:MAG: hypothetical protein WCG06_02870 [Candidatus Omnitrophota bacterium]
MRNLIVFLGMMFCLFTPSVIFTLVGYKSMMKLGNRPSGGGRVLIPMVARLLITAGVLIAVLVFFLSRFLR